MIKAKNGKVEIKGRAVDIMSELSLIIKSTKNSFTGNGIPEETVKEMIEHAVKLGLASDEELKDIFKEQLKEMLGDFIAEG